MNNRLFAAASFLLAVAFAAANIASADQPPNVVIVFADDLGYADIGCFGAEGYTTPHLDQLAKEGRRFTSFCVSQAVCGASRASLLTGCYSNRIGMLGAPSHRSKHGINANEVLISELVKQKGYATAIFGKWHLGHHKNFLPLQHGFDEYYGLPYSNDMWPYHPTSKAFPDLPLFEGNKIVNAKVTPEDQTHLTTDYTKRAVSFIDKHADKPFFLYVPHSMPHVPLFVSHEREGVSKQGLFGDVIMEIDWSVGQIVAALKRNKIDDNTLVIFTSDNGPWLSYGNHAGSAKPLREGKGTMWEGGVREPTVMWWPGKIPADTSCDELAATIDLLPTIAGLIDANLPSHAIDGKNIWPLMAGEEGAKSPHEAYCYYWGNDLHAIRSGKWKLHFPHSYRSLKGEPGKDGMPGPYIQKKCGLELYDLHADVGETTDVSADNPEVVKRLQKLADEYRKELGDGLRDKSNRGNGYRPPGRLVVQP